MGVFPKDHPSNNMSKEFWEERKRKRALYSDEDRHLAGFDPTAGEDSKWWHWIGAFIVLGLPFAMFLHWVIWGISW